MAKVLTLVMAGGKGTRLWPHSNENCPKQYLNLAGDQSLIYQALNRFEGLVHKAERYVITTVEQQNLMEKHSAGVMNAENILFEPAGRNTAPCILFSLAEMISRGVDENSVVAIVPSDHVILNENEFRNTLSVACEMAANNEKIVIIGIKPHSPHTGYGYIQQGSKFEKGYEVFSFKEKPDFQTAQKYLASGDYLWNAGMFVAPIKTLLQELEVCSPDIFKYFSALKDAHGDAGKQAQVYNDIPKDSIDYAVMEKTKNVLVVPATFDWNDLGSWDALESVHNKREGNILLSSGSYVESSKDNIIVADNKFVALIDVNDLVVVDHDQALLVMNKSKTQNVKNVIEYLKTKSDLKSLL